MHLFPTLLMLLAVSVPLPAHAAPTSQPSYQPAPTHNVPKPVVIVPKLPKTTPPVSGFQLAPGKGDTLILSFFSRDKRLRFDSANSFVIQLNTPEAIQLDPSVITGTEWPNVSKPLTLRIKGAARGKVYPVAGAAAYGLCGPQPKACRKVKVKIHYKLTG